MYNEKALKTAGTKLCATMCTLYLMNLYVVVFLKIKCRCWESTCVSVNYRSISGIVHSNAHTVVWIVFSTHEFTLHKMAIYFACCLFTKEAARDLAADFHLVLDLQYSCRKPTKICSFMASKCLKNMIIAEKWQETSNLKSILGLEQRQDMCTLMYYNMSVSCLCSFFMQPHFLFTSHNKMIKC